jgi:hypothetical protein
VAVSGLSAFVSTPTIPQPSYPGGGPFGQMPAYQPINLGTPGGGSSNPLSSILGGAQAQDLYSQSLMNSNFANLHPQLNAAQQGFQSQLGTNLGISNQFNADTAGTLPLMQNSIGQLGAASQKFTNMLTNKNGPGQQNLSTISNAAQGKYSNPLLQQAFGNFTGEASGNQPINPIVQQTMMQSGLTNAAQNLAPTSLGTGQTGESQVAKNLGVSAESYIQNMQNQGLQGIGQLNQDVTSPAQAYLGQLQSLQGQTTSQYGSLQGELANEANSMQQTQNQQQSMEAMMFPKTQIGLSGTDVANTDIANTQGLNQFNQANFASQMSAAQYNSSIAGQNAALGASSTNSLVSGGASAIAAVAIAAFCGIARSVLGIHTNEWLGFRHWIHNHASRRARQSYLRALRTGQRHEWDRRTFARIASKYRNPVLCCAF